MAQTINVGCYKRWVLQTLGLSEARHIVGYDRCYKRWASPRPGISWGVIVATNVGCYKRWASPRPGILWGAIILLQTFRLSEAIRDFDALVIRGGRMHSVVRPWASFL